MAVVRVYTDSDLLTRAAAEHVLSVYESVIASQTHFSIALSGGSTPKALYRLLADKAFNQNVDWSQVHVFWGDERCVPPDHADSNYHMARLALLDLVPIPLSNVHRMHGEDEPALAAEAYERVLREFFAHRGEQVRLDLVLLGMGDDGHTASLFPHTTALGETERLVVANYVEKLNTWRLTLTAGAINAARNVTFLVSGAGKAERVQQVIEGEHQPQELPSQLIQPTSGNLLCLLDESAASKLKR